MTREIVSRKDAIEKGLLKYFSGKPCGKGHVCERYTKKSTCLMCDSERHLAKNLSTEKLEARNARNSENKRAWRIANPEHNRIKQAEYRAKECPEKKKIRMMKWRLENSQRILLYKNKNKERANELERERRKLNPERFKAIRKKYMDANPERSRQVVRAWNLKNSERMQEVRKAYRKTNLAKYASHAASRRAMKLMATPGWADQRRIDFIYREAARMGLTVDHIVPLKSEIVCGLHWHKNMQLLPMKENIAKGNRHWPDMP